jgi:hypothetical protein
MGKNIRRARAHIREEEQRQIVEVESSIGPLNRTIVESDSLLP